ncbi:MAG: hypothetical protein J6W45_09200, partial [Bacteroidales bacterium]|nr:hypothetical protein [Bacteroidales bacterium]
MKKILTLSVVLLFATAMAQQRDRRADLGVECVTNYAVSDKGALWLSTRCAFVATAADIHSSWHIVRERKKFIGPTFECMAAWNDKVAVVAGFNSDELDDNVVLRTADGGKTWDTVVIGGKSDHWIKSLCFHNDGRLWMGSSESGLFYSDDMGKNITVLREKLDVVVSIMSIYMTDSVNGFFGTHSNGIYATHDNWRTFERLSTPADQRIKGVRPISIDRIRLWKGNLIVTQNNRVFTSPNVGKSKWRERQISDYEMDAQNDFLWAKSDSGRLVRFADWEHFQRYDVVVEKIIAVVGGNAYCGIPSGVLRGSPDGRTDTCFFLTKDRPVKDTDCWYWMNLPHGNHLWGSDRKSVFLHDSIGWYRIALLDNIKAIKPDPTSSEHIILSLKDGTQRRIDTTGNMEPCRFEKPFDKFVDAGVQSIEIETFSAGCFHYNSDIVRYTRNASEFFEDGDKLKNDNDVFFRPEIRPQPLTDADAEKIEKALKQLGERYDAAPKASDFGLADTTIDVEAILKESNRAASTNHIGYKITIVSNNGDTVRLRGSQSEMNEVACHTRYP